jgi:CHAT domain-containing protein
LQELNSQPSAEPRILAAAFADETVTHTVHVGDNTFKFSGLPFAGIEVSILARTLDNIQTYIDNDFSLASLRSRLNTFNILHFATHASLVPKDAGESFILFGNGDRPTIRDIENWRLSRVEMVVLSACETGLGGFDNNGEQVLGLGYQFQRQGAKSVVASLWRVDDGGTQALMNAFYLAINAGYSKTEALQKAQLALIKDDLSIITGENRSATIDFVDTITGNPIRLQASPDHPYYWAPFILIGNGL